MKPFLISILLISIGNIAVGQLSPAWEAKVKLFPHWKKNITANGDLITVANIQYQSESNETVFAHKIMRYNWEDKGALSEEIPLEEFQNNLSTPKYTGEGSYNRPFKDFYIGDNIVIVSFFTKRENVRVAQKNPFVDLTRMNNVGVGIIDMNRANKSTQFVLNEDIVKTFPSVKTIDFTTRSSYNYLVTECSDGTFAILGNFSIQPYVDYSDDVPFLIKIDEAGKPVSMNIYPKWDWFSQSIRHEWIEESSILLIESKNKYSTLNLLSGELHMNVNRESYLLDVEKTIIEKDNLTVIASKQMSSKAFLIVQNKISRKEYNTTLTFHTSEGVIWEIKEEVLNQIFPNKKPKYTFFEYNEMTQILCIGSEMGFMICDDKGKIIQYFFIDKPKKDTEIFWNGEDKILFRAASDILAFQVSE